MSRLPRIAVPGCPHHVTARGNRREPVFFEDGDQDIYCDMLAEQVRKKIRGRLILLRHNS
jgi:putative transposase